MDRTLYLFRQDSAECSSPLALLESLTKHGFIRIVYTPLGRLLTSACIFVGDEPFVATDRSKSTAAEKAAQLAFEHLHGLLAKRELLWQNDRDAFQVAQGAVAPVKSDFQDDASSVSGLEEISNKQVLQQIEYVKKHGYKVHVRRFTSLSKDTRAPLFNVIIDVPNLGEFKGHSTESSGKALKNASQKMTLFLANLPPGFLDKSQLGRTCAGTSVATPVTAQEEEEAKALVDISPTTTTCNSQFNPLPRKSPSDATLMKQASIINRFNSVFNVHKTVADVINELRGSIMDDGAIKILDSTEHLPSDGTFLTRVKIEEIAAEFSHFASQEQESADKAMAKAVDFLKKLSQLVDDFRCLNVRRGQQADLIADLRAKYHQLITVNTSRNRGISQPDRNYLTVIRLAHLCSFAQAGPDETSAKEAAAEEAVSYLSKLANQVHTEFNFDLPLAIQVSDA